MAPVPSMESPQWRIIDGGEEALGRGVAEPKHVFPLYIILLVFLKIIIICSLFYGLFEFSAIYNSAWYSL